MIASTSRQFTRLAKTNEKYRDTTRSRGVPRNSAARAKSRAPFHPGVLHCMCVPASCKNSVNLISLWWFAEDPSEGWRCPACQNGSTVIPTLYRCYCGKITNPRPRSRGDLTAPHSCGDLCGQNLAKTPQSSCQHKCQLLCHPGTVYESKKHQHFYPS